MNATSHLCRQRAQHTVRECYICGSKAIGINFGAPTCAPCKAFFRRNARRKEILESSCQHSDINTSEEDNIDTDEMLVSYSKIRRCSSCRLRRCFQVGMKEELVRTDEENERHKQLVDANRRRRGLLKQQKIQDNRLVLRQHTTTSSYLLSEIDWRHLSNIVYAYDTYCLKIYLEQRANIFSHTTMQNEAALEHYKLLPLNLAYTISSFLRTLPAFQSLSRSCQSYLYQNNLRRLIFVNSHELNQSCFSEPWQAVARQASWKFICGSELHQEFVRSEALAEKLLITDPIVTRLWMITLFFSTSLFCYYDAKSSIVKVKNKKWPYIDVQNAYATLLWKYLVHRHGPAASVQIYANLIHVFLNMLRLGSSINIRLRSHSDLTIVHDTLDQLTTLDINSSP